MRNLVRRVALGGAVGVVVAGVAAPAMADEGAARVSCGGKFSRVMELNRGSVHGARLSGRYAKWHKAPVDDGYYVAYGKAHAKRLSAHAVVCLVSEKGGRIGLRPASRAQLRATVGKRDTWRYFAVSFNRYGHVNKIVQQYHP
ncbi:hypothetical protein [Actinomadura harenae]|uniref:Uncharacterized protein n=1 Tax=Actinomadura harenae TaxID=2483351 RepID=A0A3M2MEZ8_9ACTN|nr:hypothetical protein [Actinomadura harenae]RMI47453.1 hypothetical protein EBO15_02825 [Actinomadura harenae]